MLIFSETVGISSVYFLVHLVIFCAAAFGFMLGPLVQWCQCSEYEGRIP